MSNRRILKKRDRHRLIIGVLSHAYVCDHETLRGLREMKRAMDKMTMPTLLRLCDAILFEQVRRYSPLMVMPHRKVHPDA